MSKRDRDLQVVPQLVRTMRPGWLAYRTVYALKRRSGYFERRWRSASWDETPLAGFLSDGGLADPTCYLNYRREHSPPFLFSPDDREDFAALLTRWDREDCHPGILADEIVRGSFRYFGHLNVEAGESFDWHRNPLNGRAAPRDRHWSRIDEFAYGDVKLIWEPSRFGFTFPLVRAYWRTGDEIYPQRFWQLVESWRLSNQPRLGVNWACGQETSLRVMAWCFGLYGFLNSSSTTARSVANLARLIAASGERIEANLGYAVSQQNNHAISEGLGLWTIGLLFPEFKSSARWRERGRQMLERQAQELIYDDGGFAQHSTNYHRFMLHAYLWCLRLGDVNGDSLDANVRARVSQAAQFLFQVQDDTSGQVPILGHNDGSLLLALSNGDSSDFRPVIQAVRALTDGVRTYEPGSWDEDLLWIFGPTALDLPLLPPGRVDLAAEDSGCYTLRTRDGFAFIRCGSFRHRPAHPDALHLDLWWRGQNIALDPGTFSYNDDDGWHRNLQETARHNTVTVDGQSQMQQAGRFLWLPWIRAQGRHPVRSQRGCLAYWEGAHDGYHRLSGPVTYRRGVARLGQEHWLVIDELNSDATHQYRLHWLLLDLPYTVLEGRDGESAHWALSLQSSAGPYQARVGTLQGCAEFDVVRADATSPRGWRASNYMSLQPAVSLALTQESMQCVFWTLFGPPVDRLFLRGRVISVQRDGWQADITLGTDTSQPLASRIEWSLAGNKAVERIEPRR